MAKGKLELRNEALSLFMKEFEEIDTPPLEYFHPFLCPVAIAEAMVREHLVEDYNVLELLVLRLYHAGFHDVEQLASLSGMKEEVVQKALDNEIMVYHHINMEDGSITEMGYQTLKENENGSLIKHTMYLTPRRMQIEAATGTVIPGYLEDKIEFMKNVWDERFDGVVPKEAVEQDEELRREINERIQEYKHMDILNEGDTIVEIEQLRSTQIYYRWAYLAQFHGMKYPMIVMRGYRSIDNVNADSVQKALYGKHVAVPLAISKTDQLLFEQYGMEIEGVLVREDEMFEYLNEQIEAFDFSRNIDDIQVDEDEDVVYADEQTNDTEVEETLTEEGGDDE